MIQTGMAFDSAPGGTEIGPWKGRQAEVNRRGSQRIKWSLAAKIMAWRQPLTAAQSVSRQGPVPGIGFCLR